VIGINPNEDENYPEDSFVKMKEYMQQWGAEFIYLRDESQEVAMAFGAVCTPDPFLFDTDLKLIYHGRIDDTHGKVEGNHELHAIIAKFLKSGGLPESYEPSLGCSIKWKEVS
jgi:hypothetical protein